MFPVRCEATVAGSDAAATSAADPATHAAADLRRLAVAPARRQHGPVLLEASRRVDWRFLLPDPHLHEVLYVGPEQAELGRSLKLFSEALTVVDGLGGLRGLSTQYDTVVLVEPGEDVLEAAARLVRPSAFLYLEARTIWPGPRASRAGKKRMRFVADYLSAIERLGFQPAETHWHWPDFDSCAEMVPLGETTSLLHALGRRRTTLAARWKTSLCRGLVRLGIFSYFAPCFSLVARRKATPERNGHPLLSDNREGRRG